MRLVAQRWSLGLLPLTACVVENPLLVDGRLWCDTAVGANGTRPGLIDIAITEAGAWVNGCVQLCMYEHDLMVMGEDDQIGLGDPLWDDYVQVRLRVRNAAIAGCEERTATLEANGDEPIDFLPLEGDVTCSDAVVTYGDPFDRGPTRILQSACGIGAASGGTGGDTDTDTDGSDESDEAGGATPAPAGVGRPRPIGGPALYGYESYADAIACHGSPLARSCAVAPVFIDGIADDVNVLFADAFLFDHGSTADGVPGFVLATCGTTSLPYALGLREGDVVTHVGGTPVATFDQAVEVAIAFGYGQAPTATITYERAGQTRSLKLTRTP